MKTKFNFLAIFLSLAATSYAWAQPSDQAEIQRQVIYVSECGEPTVSMNEAFASGMHLEVSSSVQVLSCVIRYDGLQDGENTISSRPRGSRIREVKITENRRHQAELVPSVVPVALSVNIENRAEVIENQIQVLKLQVTERCHAQRAAALTHLVSREQSACLIIM